MPPQNSRELLYVGAVRYARAGWEKFFAEPQAPERYGAEAARKYVEEKRVKQEEQANVTPFSCYLSSVCVLDQDGQTVLATACDVGETYSASLALVRFAVQRSASNLLWCGFGMRDILLSAAVEVMRYNVIEAGGNSDVPTVSVPYSLWFSRPFQSGRCLDPYEALVPSQLRADIDLSGLCDFLGLPLPSLLLAESHVERAQLAFSLSRVARFDAGVFA